MGALTESLETEKGPEEQVVQTEPPRSKLPLRKILPVAIVLVVAFNLWLLMRNTETEDDATLKSTPKHNLSSPQPILPLHNRRYREKKVRSCQFPKKRNIR